MFPLPFGLEETFYVPLAKNFNDDLDASHYLYRPYCTSFVSCELHKRTDGLVTQFPAYFVPISLSRILSLKVKKTESRYGTFNPVI